MTMSPWLASLLLVVVQATGARSLVASKPATLEALDAGKLKGDPTQLAWSPDNSQLFLQTSERDSVGMIKNPRFYIIDAATGKMASVAAAPEWAASYWAWKSNKSAPGSSAFAIDIKQEIKTSTATSAPMGGSLARGGGNFNPNGGGTTIEDVTMRAQQLHKQQVITLTLKNEIVGEFVNQPFLPGYTFGWAPQGFGMIAYCNESGHVIVMDEHGEKQELAGAKDAVLPAWSADGSQNRLPSEGRQEEVRAGRRGRQAMRTLPGIAFAALVALGATWLPGISSSRDRSAAARPDVQGSHIARRGGYHRSR